jgi:hypothetical protein
VKINFRFLEIKVDSEFSYMYNLLQEQVSLRTWSKFVTLAAFYCSDASYLLRCDVSKLIDSKFIN